MVVKGEKETFVMVNLEEVGTLAFRGGIKADIKDRPIFSAEVKTGLLMERPWKKCVSQATIRWQYHTLDLGS